MYHFSTVMSFTELGPKLLRIPGVGVSTKWSRLPGSLTAILFSPETSWRQQWYPNSMSSAIQCQYIVTAAVYLQRFWNSGMSFSSLLLYLLVYSGAEFEFIILYKKKHTLRIPELSMTLLLLHTISQLVLKSVVKHIQWLYKGLGYSNLVYDVTVCLGKNGTLL